MNDSNRSENFEEIFENIYEIQQVLEGLVMCNRHLALLNSKPIVIRRDYLNLDEVKILSGGSSGFEPAFSGFVGGGMLTAAVQGRYHESPIPYLITNALKELLRRNPNGVFVIIGSNSSDIIHFRLALERVRNIPNVRTKMLVVPNDSNTPSSKNYPSTMVLLQKIAGAMAESKYGLSEIHNFCQSALENVIGETVYLQPLYKELLNDEEKVSYVNQMQNLMKNMFLKMNKKIHGYESVEQTEHVVLLINDFGNTSKLDEYLLLKGLLEETYEKKIVQVFLGNFVSRDNLYGFSVAALRVTNEDILKYLNSSTNAPAWNSIKHIPHDFGISGAYITMKLEKFEQKVKTNKGPRLQANYADKVEKIGRFICNALVACEWQINQLDEEEEDMGTGSKIKVSASAVFAYIKKNPDETFWPHKMFLDMSDICEKFSRGYICTVYSLMLAAAAKPFLEMDVHDHVTVETWLKCLESVCECLEKYNKELGYKQPVAEPLFAYLRTFQKEINDGNSKLLDMVKLATQDAENVASLPVLPGGIKGDAGAHTVRICLRALYDSIKCLPT